jgi:hypothetical protein
MTIIPNYDNFQPRFKLYMEHNGLKPGDHYKSYEYINWICELAANFKASRGKSPSDVIAPDEQDKFTDYIKDKVG